MLSKLKQTCLSCPILQSFKKVLIVSLHGLKTFKDFRIFICSRVLVPVPLKRFLKCSLKNFFKYFFYQETVVFLFV